jgi:hypothetical protein
MFAAWGGDSMVKWAARKAKEIKENKNVMAKIEKRVAEIRMEATENESRKIVGYAAVFNKDSEDLGGFVERIAPGAFSKAIGISDVRALFNHDNNMVLARNTSGTLELIEDETGLRYEFDAPNTSYGNDLLEMIKRGDISQSSFGFTVENDDWEQRDGKTYRTITKVKRLYDVSPVTFPAYPEASVAVRKLEQLQQDNKESHTFENDVTLKKIKATLKYYA